MKYSGSRDLHVAWAGAGLLAISMGDSFIRLWNLDSSENFVLDLQGSVFRDSEYVMSLCFSPNKSKLSSVNKYTYIKV